CGSGIPCIPAGEHGLRRRVRPPGPQVELPAPRTHLAVSGTHRRSAVHRSQRSHRNQHGELHGPGSAGHAHPRREAKRQPGTALHAHLKRGRGDSESRSQYGTSAAGSRKVLRWRKALISPLCPSCPLWRAVCSAVLASALCSQLFFQLMSTLVECVPNFSEGRDKAKVDAIIDAMKMPGVYLLDREMDSDHNRCVITLVGEREAIQEAAIRGVGKAAELIDLNVHTGAHPRMGASDVVPFIPIDGVTIEDCVAMANHVGEQIWKRFQIPVYLYEAAARTPERQGLENIRRGQFEGIRAEIATNPARRPDFGDPRVLP